MSDVLRIYVKKREEFDTHGMNLMEEMREILKIRAQKVWVYHVYDVQNLTREDFDLAVREILMEVNVDEIFDAVDFEENQRAFRVQYLPGQYDQRADSAMACIKLLKPHLEPVVQSSTLYVFEGIDGDELQKIKKYLINPVDSREVPLGVPENLGIFLEEPSKVPPIHGFIYRNDRELKTLLESYALAMSLEDLKKIQEYFLKEDRDPTVTELRVLDTYWSDHCRHTTFNTEIEEVDLSANNLEALEETYQSYLASRKQLERHLNPDTLMELATVNLRLMKKKGLLDDLEVSEEINAVSLVAPNPEKDLLVMFKNETHNHPTEIEPFGGAATCLGGAIRDPLSGRAYVYQSMRISGASDPRTPLEETLAGKLPQRVITREAARGFSAYGNQIGLNTGFVKEYYHPGFEAKRMEVGFVIGATPLADVTRKKPSPGDLVLLLGGATGRDGIGGATGSSKSHDIQSIEISGAEVQKGNPPMERRIQRLFMDPKVSRSIKRSNDFGAGGISVALGEIADALEVDLDKVPKKYQGLDGTELAISESQERMAVVIAPQDLEAFLEASAKENLPATVVAKVTDNHRFRLLWRGETILDLDRDFLDAGGAGRRARVKVDPVNLEAYPLKGRPLDERIFQDINAASQRGLVEQFDNSIGRCNVLSFYGGKHLDTPIQGMVSKLPFLSEDNPLVSIVTHGYEPLVAQWSPFHGGMYAVVGALSKQVALGASLKRVRLAFQEYFERLGDDPSRWGRPFSALLGANRVLDAFDLASVGGKDSMSGTFVTQSDERIDVPPTLIAFGVSLGSVHRVISPEFKGGSHDILLFRAPKHRDHTFDLEAVKAMYREVESLIEEGKVYSGAVIESEGLYGALAKMTFGNEVGCRVEAPGEEDYFASILLEVDKGLQTTLGLGIGVTQEEKTLDFGGEKRALRNLKTLWEAPLASVFPTEKKVALKKASFECYRPPKPPKGGKTPAPRVFIPVFPGTNCEFDTAYGFEKAGGRVNTQVFRNLRPSDIENSIRQMEKAIRNSEIIALAGGFSAGDEPEGSGKFIASVLKNPRIAEAVMDLLENRDGLILGICNGFQALIKTGLLPYGRIQSLDKRDPTLTFNPIGRHVAQMVYTRVKSQLSPWLAYGDPDRIYTTPVSHGEGRLILGEDHFNRLREKGQIALQYVTPGGEPAEETRYNPNASDYGVEALSSEDGRILGKMGHTERIGRQLAINVPDKGDLRLFEAGVHYFK